MSGIAAVTRIYQSAPRIIKHKLPITFPGSGANPLDTALQTLPNANGQLTIVMVNTTSGFRWEFEVEGGMGQFASDNANNWSVNLRSFDPTTVTVVVNADNDYTFTTPAADGGGRSYRFLFSPYLSVAPQIQRTAGANIGTDNVTITITYYRVKL